MHRGFIIVFSIFVLLIMGMSIRADVGVGDQPEIDITTLGGMRITNGDLRGHVTVVDFWATWCGPCVSSMPHMKKLYEQLHPQGVVFLGISLDSDADKAKNFVEKKGYEWPQHCDERGWKAAMANRWGVNSIPRIFLLNPVGEVIWTGHPSGLDGPLHNAVKKYSEIMAEAMRRKSSSSGNDEPQQLDEATREKAVASLDAAKTAMQEQDFTAMLQSLNQIPDVAYADNHFALQCRSMLEAISKLPRDQQTALNKARRSDKELAKAYGTFVKAARSARVSS